MFHNVFLLCFYVVIAKVMFDYDAGGDDELSLKKGELVEVLDQKDDGWWKGLLNCGKIGLFPTNFVELEKDSVSIPKFQPTFIPVAPAKVEPGELKHTIYTYCTQYIHR